MAELKTHTKFFDGIKVMTTELSFSRAARLEARLAKLVMAAGPVIFSGSRGLKDLDMSAFTGALNSLEGDQLVRLLLDVFASSSAISNGERIDLTSEEELNQAFNGHLLAGHEAALWVIGINFTTFGKGLLAKLGVEAVKEEPST